MRIVSPDHGQIDYIYEEMDKERLGIRVRSKRAMLMRSDGNDLDRMVVFGDYIMLPTDELRLFPFDLRGYMETHPNSDLADVLSGAKSFKDAVRDTRQD